MINLIFLLAAFPALPIAFAFFCRHLKREVPERPPILAYFFLFGTVGGWFLALGLSPSPLCIMCMLPLITLAPLALIGSSIALLFEKSRSVYHDTAIQLGFGYPVVLAGWIGVLALAGAH